MNVDIINHFSKIVVNTFNSAFSVTPYRCGDFLRVDGDIKNPDDLMCILTFSGDVTGTIIMTFPEETAKKIYEALMFEKTEELNEEVQNAFTEILNMIAGNLRASFNGDKNETGSPSKTISFDTPMVAIGKAKYENSEDFPWLYIPMNIDSMGRFSLLIAVKDN